MEVFESTARRLRADLARIQVDGRLPSVVAALVRDGEVCWSDGYGDVPGPPDEVAYRIGSITKTLTAVAVLRLARQGAVDLDDPVARWWPDAPYGGGTGGVTLRALLGHGAGLPAEPAGAWWERAGRSVHPRDLVAAESGLRPPHRPGVAFHYSNLGYALLGEVVARARGRGWWEVVHDEVLAPLGMDRTTYDASTPSARGWSVHPYTSELLSEPATDTGAMAAAGQLWSTTADLARWTTFCIAGHADVLDVEDLTAAYEPQVGHGALGPGTRHGLGFQLVTTSGESGGGRELVGHAGSMPGFVASCFADRARRTGAVLLANGTTGLVPAEAARRLLATLEAAEPALPGPWRPTTRLPVELEPLLGVWHWGARPQVWSMEGERIVARESGRVVHRFAVRAGRVVGVDGYLLGEQVHLRHAADGTAYLEVATFVLTREPYTPGDVVPGGTPAV